MMAINQDSQAKSNTLKVSREQALTQVLKEKDVQISMDGKGSWRNNVFVERFWRSFMYEEVYLHAYDSVSAVKAGLSRYFDFKITDVLIPNWIG